MEVSIETDASQFTKFANELATNVTFVNPDMLRGFENAQAIYLGEMRKQFMQNSRGGGDWPDLAPSTKLKRFYDAGGRFKREKGVTHAQRLQQVAAMPFPILYVSGTLYTSLYPDSPGNIFQNSEDSVSAGTDIFYGAYHQQGGGRLPQRRILTEPTQDLLIRMTQPITAGLRAAINKAAGIEAPAEYTFAAA